MASKRAGKLFPYSGSKGWALDLLPAPPPGTKTIKEPFAGSMAYSLRHRPEHFIGADSSVRMQELWAWLGDGATVERLAYIESTKPTEKIQGPEHAKIHGLSPAEATLVHLKTSGAYVGQFSSTILWPKHNLDLSALKAALPYIQSALYGVLEDYQQISLKDVGYQAMAFVDPPYLGTSGNYAKGSGGLDVEAFRAWLLASEIPTLVTYGQGPRSCSPSWSGSS